MFSFSKSLKGNRVNLFSGEEGRESWERRQFRNNIREGGGGGGGEGPLEKGLHTGALYRDVDRKFLAPIPLSMRDARELSNPKDFRSVAPLSASSRYVRIPIRFQSLGNAFIAFLLFLPFSSAEKSFQTSSLPTPQFPIPLDETTKIFSARKNERRERFGTWHSKLHAFFRPTEKFFFEI